MAAMYFGTGTAPRPTRMVECPQEGAPAGIPLRSEGIHIRQVIILHVLARGCHGFVLQNAEPLYADDVDKHIPKNVKLQLIGEETDADGKTYIVSELSWDADSAVSVYEMRPFILNDQDGNIYEFLIKGNSSQSIAGNNADEPSIPAAYRYKTENGRNIFRLRILKLKANEEYDAYETDVTDADIAAMEREEREDSPPERGEAVEEIADEPLTPEPDIDEAFDYGAFF